MTHLNSLTRQFTAAALLAAVGTIFPPTVSAQGDKPAAEERGEAIIPLRDANIIGVSPDGKALAIWDARHPEGKLELWDLSTGERTRSVTLPIGVAHAKGELVYSPDGRFITIATHKLNRGVFVIDLEAEKLVAAHHLNRAEDNVTPSFLSPDGKLFATYDDHGTVSVRKTETGEVIRKFEGHREWMRATVFSGDGRRLLTMARDGREDKTFQIRIWDIGMGNEMQEEIVALNSHYPALSSKGKMWAIYDADIDKVRVQTVEEVPLVYRLPIQLLPIQLSAFPLGKLILLDDALIAVDTNSAAAECWHLTGELQWRIEKGRRAGGRNRLLALSLAVGHLLMSSNREDRPILIYDLKSGEQVTP